MDTPGGSYTPPPPAPPTSGGGAAGEQLVYPANPPKDPTIILILNLLLFGGVGYIIMGQKTKGIVAAVVWVAGLATCGILSGIVQILAAVDGYMQAQQLQAGFPVAQWTFFNDHR